MGYDVLKSALCLVKCYTNLTILLTNCATLGQPLCFRDLGILLCEMGEVMATYPLH